MLGCRDSPNHLQIDLISLLTLMFWFSSVMHPTSRQNWRGYKMLGEQLVRLRSISNIELKLWHPLCLSVCVCVCVCVRERERICSAWIKLTTKMHTICMTQIRCFYYTCTSHLCRRFWRIKQDFCFVNLSGVMWLSYKVCVCVTVANVSLKGVTAGSVHRANTALHCSPWMDI